MLILREQGRAKELGEGSRGGGWGMGGGRGKGGLGKKAKKCGSMEIWRIHYVSQKREVYKCYFRRGGGGRGVVGHGVGGGKGQGSKGVGWREEGRRLEVIRLSFVTSGCFFCLIV